MTEPTPDNKHKDELELTELILLTIDDQITDEQFARLDKLITENPKAAQQYIDIMGVYTSLNQMNNLSIGFVPTSDKIDTIKSGIIEIAPDQSATKKKDSATPDPTEDDNHLLKEVVDRDLNDTAMRQALLESDSENLDNTPSLQYKRQKPTRRDMINAFIRIAAVFIFSLAIIYIDRQVRRPKPAPQIVGTITGLTEPVWKSNFYPTQLGADVRTVPMQLLEGYVELTLRKGTQILIQAPCEFELESEQQIHLISGSLTAKVPPQAKGFAVRTNGASIIDYGTEFGVVAHRDGETEAHVFKGEVDLRSGSDAVRFNDSKRLVVGQAGKINKTGSLKLLPAAQKERFTRELPVKIAFGQPGKRLDLSDIASGGNGFGTGDHNFMIDPTNGQFIEFTIRGQANRSSKEKFNRVPSLSFIDGVFVPAPSSGPVIVSSQNDIFKTCPPTLGLTRKDIVTLDRVYQSEEADLFLNSTYYGTPEHPAISMHANMGITFDLNSIRESIPGVNITRFKTFCGISNANTPEQPDQKADFWVLIDGQMVSSYTDARLGLVKVLDVNIPKTARFLTLITTENDGTILNDRCVFAEPVLLLDNTIE